MKNNHLNSPSHKRRNEDKHSGAQMKKVFKAFQEHPKTMLTVSVETGILRANICRYVSKWRKENRIQVIRKGICPISKHGASFLSTHPKHFIKPFNTTER